MKSNNCYNICTWILLSLQNLQHTLSYLIIFFTKVIEKKNIPTFPLSWKNYCPIFFANFFGSFFSVFGHFQHSSNFLICLPILVPDSILKLYQTTIIFCVLLNLAIVCLNTGEHTWNVVLPNYSWSKIMKTNLSLMLPILSNYSWLNSSRYLNKHQQIFLHHWPK